MLHEMFRNAHRGIRRNVLFSRGMIFGRGNDDGMLNCPVGFQVLNDPCHGRTTLPDRTVDTQYLLVALVDHRVDGNRSFARLPVAEYQLSLATPDGNQRINDFDSGLKRNRNGSSIHDGSRRTFYWKATNGSNWP